MGAGAPNLRLKSLTFAKALARCIKGEKNIAVCSVSILNPFSQTCLVWLGDHYTTPTNIQLCCQAVTGWSSCSCCCCCVQHILHVKTTVTSCSQPSTSHRQNLISCCKCGLCKSCAGQADACMQDRVHTAHDAHRSLSVFHVTVMQYQIACSSR